MYGEYWADDLGQVLFADGDIGDFNHESIALDFLTRRIFDILDFQDDELNDKYYGPISEWEKKLCEFLECSKSSLIEALTVSLLKNLADEKEKNPEYTHSWTDENKLSAAILAAFNFQDPSLYMIQHEGWIRTKGNNLEIWEITNQNLDLLASVIYEIEQDTPHVTEEFTLESRGEEICYTGVSYAVITRGDISGLQKYRM